ADLTSPPGGADSTPAPGGADSTLRLAGRGASRARIVFDHVSVEFPSSRGALRVVDDVSYEIADGEFVAIIGPSGCGKTTMMNMVAGFVQPARGRGLLHGQPS